FATKRPDAAEPRRRPFAQCPSLDVDVLFLPQLARGCSRSLYGDSSKSVPKKYAPHRERLGLHVCPLYITFPAKINALRHCKMNFSAFDLPILAYRLTRPDQAETAENQSPVPGFEEKYCSFPDTPSHCLASAGGSFFTVMLGQVLAYSALIPSHFSRPGSVSGLIASTGHSGSQTPQSMHSSGWMTSMFSSSYKQSTGQTSTQSISLHLIQDSLTT